MSHSIVERLLEDAAKAYIKAERLDAADPPVRVDDAARWLNQQREQLPAELLDGIFFSEQVSLRDVFEIIQALEERPYYKEQYKKTWEEQNEWILPWVEARNILRDRSQGNPNERYRKALGPLKLILRGRRNKKRDMEKLKSRYYQLREKDNCLTHAKAIWHLVEEFQFEGKDPYSTCKQALYRAGVRTGRR